MMGYIHRNTIRACLLFLMSIGLINAQKRVAGDEAPSFNTKDINGDTIAVSELNGDGKTVFISFLRYAGCPICNARVHELTAKYEELKRYGIELIVVFESTKETLLEYTADADLPFQIVSDPENVLYDLFGVKKSFGKVLKTALKKDAKQKMRKGKALYKDKEYKRDGAVTRIPADFIIAPSGIIAQAYYGAYIGDHLDLESLLN